MKRTLLATLLSFSLVLSGQALADGLSEIEQQQLADITGFLESNPKVIPGLHQSLSAYINQKNQFEQVLERHYDFLTSNPDHSQFGAEEPELVITNFTDYNCPYCKKLDPVLHQIALAYPGVKVVNVYVPIKEMGNILSTTTTASYALNVWKHAPEKYFEVNQLLQKKSGLHDLRSMRRIAEKTGTTQWLTPDAATKELVDKNYQVFSQLGLAGTPAMLIGDAVLPGYLPFDKLKEVVESKLENNA